VSGAEWNFIDVMSDNDRDIEEDDILDDKEVVMN
jgi:hypothetical protein